MNTQLVRATVIPAIVLAMPGAFPVLPAPLRNGKNQGCISQPSLTLRVQVTPWSLNLKRQRGAAFNNGNAPGIAIDAPDGGLSPSGAEGTKPPVAGTGKSADEIIADFRRDWEVQPGYMRRMDDRGWKARMAALCELMKLGSRAVPALVQSLQDGDAELRAFAAQALGFLADASVAERMDQILATDSDAITRLYAADALGMIGGVKPKDLYEQVAKADSNKDVRAHVRFALERNGESLSPEVQNLFRDFDYSKMDSAKPGEAAPDFVLTDALGKTHRLSDFRGNEPVVLIFIYGDT